MAPWIIPLASFLANSGSKQKQKDEMRQQLLNQYAQSLGGGGPELQVAQWQKQQRDADGGMANLLPLIQLAGAFGGSDSSGPGGWTTQAAYRGPGKVARAGYAGPISARDF